MYFCSPRRVRPFTTSVCRLSPANQKPNADVGFVDSGDYSAAVAQVSRTHCDPDPARTARVWRGAASAAAWRVPRAARVSITRRFAAQNGERDENRRRKNTSNGVAGTALCCRRRSLYTAFTTSRDPQSAAQCVMSGSAANPAKSTAAAAAVVRTSSTDLKCYETFYKRHTVSMRKRTTHNRATANAIRVLHSTCASDVYAGAKKPRRV